jgi:chorismate mutase
VVRYTNFLLKAVLSSIHQRTISLQHPDLVPVNPEPILGKSEQAFFPKAHPDQGVRPFLVAGPCSAETPERFEATLDGLAPLAPDLVRAGIWKPRTRPDRFEGVGAEGLVWVRELTQRRGLRLAVEVAQPSQVEQALLHGVDAVWLGARTTVNPFLVDEIGRVLAGTGMPVLLKNPINPDLELWLGAIERMERWGLTQLALVHRGFSPFEPSPYRNMPQWEIPIELRRRRPDLPMYCDPSHITGNAQLVPEFAQIALDLCYDGWMLEVHHSPSDAWSDASQQLTPDQLRDTLGGMTFRFNDPENQELAAQLQGLRAQVDRLDHDLLELMSQRLKLSHRLGTLKKEYDLPILQPKRWEQILETRHREGASMGLNLSFLNKWLQLMHQESIQRQLDMYRPDSSKTP